jgi:hypothetical protein
MRIAILAGCLILFGCTGKDPAGPKLVPVSGAVSLNGKPVAGATVTFVPAGDTKGFGSKGKTDVDGKYSLTGNRGGAGAVPGNYKVTISKRVMPDGSEPDEDVPVMESPARETLPSKYSMGGQTTLTAIVPESGGAVDFKLAK